MPNYYRLSLDHLEKEVKRIIAYGHECSNVMLCKKVPENLKDNKGQKP